MVAWNIEYVKMHVEYIALNFAFLYFRSRWGLYFQSLWMRTWKANRSSCLWIPDFRYIKKKKFMLLQWLKFLSHVFQGYVLLNLPKGKILSVLYPQRQDEMDY